MEVKNRIYSFRTKWQYLQRISLRTISFNIRHFGFRTGLKFPIWLSKQVYLRNDSGIIYIEGPIKFGMIRIGFGDVGIFDDKKSRTIWEVSGKITFKGNADIGHGCKISVACNGSLDLGKDLKITAESTIFASQKIQIGDNCLLSWDILIMDTDLHTIRDENQNIINSPKPIVIGKSVWIGCRCLILKGVHIPDNSIIGANTHLFKSIEKPSSIYAGNPAKLIKENITWEI